MPPVPLTCFISDAKKEAPALIPPSPCNSGLKANDCRTISGNPSFLGHIHRPLSLYFVCDGLPQGHLSLEACWRGICCQKDHLQGRSWAVRRPSSLKLSKCQRVGKWASNWRRHSFPSILRTARSFGGGCECVCVWRPERKSGFFSSFF